MSGNITIPHLMFILVYVHWIKYNKNNKKQIDIIYYLCQFYDATLKQEAQRAIYRATEYNVPPFWRIGQGGSFCLLIGPKNKNLVEDIEILLPVKFCWIQFSGFREEVENVSANQRLGWPSCFFQSARKTQTWYRTLRSCVLSNFVEFHSGV